MSTTKKETVTARKQYRCDLCGDLIEVGTQYHTRRVWPSEHPDNEVPFTHRAHLECHRVWGIVGRSYDWLFPALRGWADEFKKDLQTHVEAGASSVLVPAPPQGGEYDGH